jgi:hypothetical protein
MKDHNKEIRSLTEAVNNLYEQVVGEDDDYDWGDPPDGWEGPWPPHEPIIIPGDHQQDGEGWVPPLGWPHVVLSVLALLGRGYSIWAIAAMLGIPLFVVLMLVAGFKYESPIGEPLDKNPMGTPLPTKPHQQSPAPWYGPGGQPQG